MVVAAGTSNLFFSRDTKVYIKQGTNIWEVPVLNGYSFSQTTNASTITLNEMSDATGKSRRGQRVFNDSLSPAEWSFDCYARPVLVSSKMRSTDEILWASLVNSNAYDPLLATNGVTITGTPTISSGILTIAFTATTAPFKANDVVVLSGLSAGTGGSITTGTVVTATTSGATINIGTSFSGIVTPTSPSAKPASTVSTATELDFTFGSSNTTTLGTFELFFVLGGNQISTSNFLNDGDTTIYRLEECSVNEVTMNFEIDGIATFSWSGMGKTITEVDSFDATTAIVTGFKNGGALITNNLIRNRLTALNAISTSPTATTYALAITGGSITISNNMTYLTPETLGVVNQPLGHITGTRSVSGSFTTYLDEATNGSIDLYKNLVTATSTITNTFSLQFFVGGKNIAGTHPIGPGVLFDMGQCHLEIPTINNDDVIALEINFTALPSNISGTDEINKIRYVGIAP
jgi:hypothetical protein